MRDRPVHVSPANPNRYPRASRVPQRAGVIEEAKPKQPESNTPFYVVLVYLLFEFGRPQDVIPGLSAVPIPTLLSLVIAFLVISSGKVTFSNIQTKLYVALLGLMVVHGPIAVNNFEAFMTFKLMVLNFGCYLGILTFIDSVRKFQLLANVWLIVHLWLAIIGILKGGTGIGGWMGDENDFCMEINMVLSFAFFGLFSAAKNTTRFATAGLLCAYILTVITTLSRGGFIGMAAVGTYCWSFSKKKMLSAVLVVVLGCFVLLVAPAKYWSEVESIGSDQTMEQGTGGERLYTWGIGFEMFLANPIIGVGQGNFPWVFDEYQGDRTFFGKSISGRAAHSAYFTLIPELGLVGTVIFISILFFTRRDLGLIYKLSSPDTKVEAQEGLDRKRVFYLARAMEGSLIGFLVSSIFISTLYYPSLWVMLGFVVALRNVAMRTGTAAFEAPGARSPKRGPGEQVQRNVQQADS